MNVENASDTHFRTPTSARAYPPFPLNLQLQLAASWLEFYLMLTTEIQNLIALVNQ